MKQRDDWKEKERSDAIRPDDLKLKEGARLSLCECKGKAQNEGRGNNPTRSRKTFLVEDLVGEGAACVSYRVRVEGENSARGILKEFWPTAEYDDDTPHPMRRNAQGLLLPQEEDPGFQALKETYWEPHRQLQSLKQHEEKKELSSFLPYVEGFRGEDDAGTLYLWYPEAEVEPFETFCSEVRRNPCRNPERNLLTALKAVLSLSKCICALHAANVIHRDITPNNFGFRRLEGELQRENPILIDIDTICVAKGARPGNRVRTEGYTEPEAAKAYNLRRYTPENRTDIYSIGAVLFHAVILTEETRANGCLYCKGYEERLRQLVNSSELIQATENTANPQLRDMLTHILKKCLSDRPARYKCCEELISDLEHALYYILPAECKKTILTRKKWMLADVEEKLDVNQQKNSTLAIQYHLYQYPIPRMCQPEEKTVEVLAIGFGNYGQRFLDACLQAGQCCELPLSVNVLFHSREGGPQGYLLDRPMLGEFFDIIDEDHPQGTLNGRADAYGSIRFLPDDLYGENVRADDLEALLRDRFGDRHIHYAFIALGDDAWNREAAEVCRKVLKKCSIQYACEDPTAEEQQSFEGLQMRPVLVNAKMRDSNLYRQIERMAFNVHLLWEQRMLGDPKALQDRFESRYNHDACVAYVLSLKYTLERLSINLKTRDSESGQDFEWAARDFSNRLREDTLRDELIYREHRRWVTEKLCLGWRKRKIEDCADWSTRDERKKLHVCLVRSRPEQSLTSRTRAIGPSEGYRLWDTISDDELAAYDELDQTSVRLHQFFRREARQAKELDLRSESGELCKIREHIAGDKRAVAAFLDWEVCIKDLWSGETNKVRLYNGLRDAFLKTTAGLPESERKVVRETAQSFDRRFSSVVASMKYQDLKQEDVKLIDHIPFILTYSRDACLAIPYTLGNHTEFFRNVASATMANPKTILYLFRVRQPQEIEMLRDSLPRVVRYMDNKQLQATLKLVLLCKPAAIKQENIQPLWSCAGERVKAVECFSAESGMSALKEYLQRQLDEEAHGLFAIEKNDAPLAKDLEQSGVYSRFPSFRFRSDTMRFEDMTQPETEALRYLWAKPHITAADLCSLQLATMQTNSRLEFQLDYRTLWKAYSKNPNEWKKLCKTLGDNRTFSLARFKVGLERAASPKTYRYILPFPCARGAQTIVKCLLQNKILEEGSCVCSHTTDSCEVILQDSRGKREDYDRLFSHFYELTCPEFLAPQVEQAEVHVRFDSLAAQDISIGKSQRQKELLDLLQKEGYILNLKRKDGQTSFLYGSRQIKRLLTKEGNMLEVYTYHSAKHSGEFDDAVTDFLLNWPGADASNEFDCILTKGFRSLIVECKASANLDSKYYDKLSDLTERLGVNARGVLVADTRGQNEEKNAGLRKYGEKKGIITVWKEEDIQNIGQVLHQIMENTWRP